MLAGVYGRGSDSAASNFTAGPGGYFWASSMFSARASFIVLLLVNGALSPGLVFLRDSTLAGLSVCGGELGVALRPSF